MASPQIVAFPMGRQQLHASTLEQTAKQLAIAAGRLDLADLFASLPPAEQSDFRARARFVLAGRDWQDARLFAREQYAQAVFVRTFNQLDPVSQSRVLHMVDLVLPAIRAYMEGDAAALTPTTRAWAMTEDEQIYAAAGGVA